MVGGEGLVAAGGVAGQGEGGCPGPGHMAVFTSEWPPLTRQVGCRLLPQGDHTRFFLVAAGLTSYRAGHDGGAWCMVRRRV